MHKPVSGPAWPQFRRMMMLDLLEYPEEADDQIEAIHDEADADETNQRELLVTERLAERALDASEISDGTNGTTDAAIPGHGGGVGTWDSGGEEVVEAQGEGSGPGADGEDFRQGVSEFSGSTPQSKWTTEVFKLN